MAHTVGQLAKRFGLSRSTLLYYDSIGLLSPSERSGANYRLYSEADADRLERICRYRRAGLPLQKIQDVLDAEDSARDGGESLAAVLAARHDELEREIGGLREQQAFIARLLKKKDRLPGAGGLDTAHWNSLLHCCGFSDEDMRRWHREFERIAPEKHRKFLEFLGIPGDEIKMIRRWASGPHRIRKVHDMTERFMELFFEIHAGLPRQTPGTDACTRQAFGMIEGLGPAPRILDIGCGPGRSAIELARLTGGTVIAVDNHRPFLAEAAENCARAGVTGQVDIREGDMTDLAGTIGAKPGEFDLIWSEGSAFIMDVDKALAAWRPFLKDGGWLGYSELVWLTDTPHADIRAYFADTYPWMRGIEGNLEVVRAAGYEPKGHFILPTEAWADEYYTPLEASIAAARERYAGDAQAQDIIATRQLEIDLWREHGGDYGYVFIVAQKK